MTCKEKIKEYCDNAFSTHKATLVQNTDRYLIIDWRREDGSSNYYVNYIVDKQRGSFIVSGDLGDSIATWYNKINPSDIKNWIKNDIGYYVSKMQCTSDKYVCDDEEIIADIKDNLELEDIDELIDAFNEHFNDFVDDGDENELWEQLKHEVCECIYGSKFIPSKSLEEFISTFDDDYWAWLYDCGKRIHMRVHLWANGFYNACKQLKI